MVPVFARRRTARRAAPEHVAARFRPSRSYRPAERGSMRSTTFRRFIAAAGALTLATSLAACGAGRTDNPSSSSAATIDRRRSTRLRLRRFIERGRGPIRLGRRIGARLFQGSRSADRARHQDRHHRCGGQPRSGGVLRQRLSDARNSAVPVPAGDPGRAEGADPGCGEQVRFHRQRRDIHLHHEARPEVLERGSADGEGR